MRTVRLGHERVLAPHLCWQCAGDQPPLAESPAHQVSPQ